MPAEGKARVKHRDPEIEIVELKDDFVKFYIRKTDLSMANALRRVMIAEVPTLAIEFVTIHQNSSCLHDDFLAHRLGLVPLDSRNVSKFNYQRDCNCLAGCADCTIKFKLDVKNDSDETVHVTSRDLRLMPARGDMPDVEPVNNQRGDEILLCKLGANQHLSLEAVAIKGIGKEHSKWCPVAVATFQQEPIIEIDQDEMAMLSTEEKKKFVESSPNKIFRYDELNDTVEVDDKLTCTFINECVLYAESIDREDLVSIEVSEDTYIFSVETTGVIKAKEVVLRAMQALRDKMAEMENELELLKKGAQQTI